MAIAARSSADTAAMLSRAPHRRTDRVISRAGRLRCRTWLTS